MYKHNEQHLPYIMHNVHAHNIPHICNGNVIEFRERWWYDTRRTVTMMMMWSRHMCARFDCRSRFNNYLVHRMAPHVICYIPSRRSCDSCALEVENGWRRGFEGAKSVTNPSEYICCIFTLYLNTQYEAISVNGSRTMYRMRNVTLTAELWQP